MSTKKVIAQSTDGSPLNPEVAKAIRAVYGAERSDLVGDIVPTAWHTTLPKPIAKRKGRKSNVGRRSWQYHINMSMLAHIVSWYRPKVNWLDAETIILTPKFDGSDFLKINRERLATMFGCSVSAISDGIAWCLVHGFIKRKLVPYRDPSGSYVGKALYVLPVVSKILEFSQAPAQQEDGDQDTAEQEATDRSAGANQSLSRSIPAAEQEDTDASAGASTIQGQNRNKSKIKQQQKPASESEAGEAAIAPGGAEPAAQPDSQNGGAAAPRPAVVVSPSDAGASPPAPPEEFKRFLRFYLEAYMLYKDEHEHLHLSDEEFSLTSQMFKEKSLDALQVSAILIGAWNLIGAKDERNGYQYPCCQQSLNLRKFIQHFDRITRDVDSIKDSSSFSDKQLIETLRYWLTGYYSDDDADQVLSDCFPDAWAEYSGFRQEMDRKDERFNKPVDPLKLPPGNPVRVRYEREHGLPPPPVRRMRAEVVIPAAPAARDVPKPVRVEGKRLPVVEQAQKTHDRVQERLAAASATPPKAAPPKSTAAAAYEQIKAKHSREYLKQLKDEYRTLRFVDDASKSSTFFPDMTKAQIFAEIERVKALLPDEAQTPVRRSAAAPNGTPAPAELPIDGNTQRRRLLGNELSTGDINL